MAYKPGDFFVGVIDFFGILVPGAVLLYLHGESLAGAVGLRFTQNPASTWGVFLVGSYILGHFLLGIGVPLSKLLRLYRPEKKDKFYQEVEERIKLPPGIAKNRTDVFYRAYSCVRIANSSATTEIERQMADYKLFRGLTLVFFFDVLLVGLCSKPAVTLVPRLLLSTVLFLIAAWRFVFLLDWTYRITFEFHTLLGDKGSDSHAPAAAMNE
jgi:hypothetical protein